MTADVGDERDVKREALREELHQLRMERIALEHAESDAVARARELDMSWADIGRCFGRARQVVHARFADAPGGWEEINDADLKAAGVTASAHISGRKAQALVHVEVSDGDRTVELIYDGQACAWNTVPTVLSVAHRRTLEVAGAQAQSKAVGRHAGQQKRQATIERTGVRVGRPRRQR